jgi:hypothetical protein
LSTLACPASDPGTKLDLRALLIDVSALEVEVEVGTGIKMWMSAARVRAVSIDLGLAHVPVGHLIDAEDIIGRALKPCGLTLRLTTISGANRIIRSRRRR